MDLSGEWRKRSELAGLSPSPPVWGFLMSACLEKAYLLLCSLYSVGAYQGQLRLTGGMAFGTRVCLVKKNGMQAFDHN